MDPRVGQLVADCENLHIEIRQLRKWWPEGMEILEEMAGRLGTFISEIERLAGLDPPTTTGAAE